jgi:hypothetical protein
MLGALFPPRLSTDVRYSRHNFPKSALFPPRQYVIPATEVRYSRHINTLFPPHSACVRFHYAQQKQRLTDEADKPITKEL